MPIDAMFLYDTVQSAIAGVIAAVVAAFLYSQNFVTESGLQEKWI